MMSTVESENVLTKFRDKTARVGILGQGYVGLPLAMVFAEAGFSVTGFDLDTEKVKTLNQGQSHILDVDSEKIQQLIKKGRYRAVSDFSLLVEMDAISICVPTPLRKTGDPDLSYIVSAAETLAKYIRPGQVIVLESTTYPGTTRELFLPILEEKSGLQAGKDFYLAFSPERVDPGRTDFTTVNTPKVIGGITPDCLEAAAAWYSQALDTVVPVSSTEVAEMAKLLENTFRMINIGMVNEMAIMCDRLGVDVWEVIDAAATKPFGFMKFTPGPGLGGHCIPVDPLYLSWKLRSLNYNARFIELATEINTGMPRYVIGKIQDALNTRQKALNGSKILVLGVSYKPDIDDLRESPAMDIVGLLKQKGAEVWYYDPYVPVLKHDDWLLESEKDLNAALMAADCSVIVTDHHCFNYDDILSKANLIVDTRNALGRIPHHNPSKVVKI